MPRGRWRVLRERCGLLHGHGTNWRIRHGRGLLAIWRSLRVPEPHLPIWSCHKHHQHGNVLYDVHRGGHAHVRVDRQHLLLRHRSTGNGIHLPDANGGCPTGPHSVRDRLPGLVGAFGEHRYWPVRRGLRRCHRLRHEGRCLPRWTTGLHDLRPRWNLHPDLRPSGPDGPDRSRFLLP